MWKTVQKSGSGIEDLRLGGEWTGVTKMLTEPAHRILNPRTRYEIPRIFGGRDAYRLETCFLLHHLKRRRYKLEMGDKWTMMQVRMKLGLNIDCVLTCSGIRLPSMSGVRASH